MLCNPNNNSSIKITYLLLVLFSLSLFLSGCAERQWSEPLAGDELGTATVLVEQLQAKQKNCAKTLEGDVALFYTNAFSQKAVSGFFQFSHPAAYKFVVSNPFGQPLLIITGNQKWFESINTTSRSYLAGSLSSLALRNNIPPFFVSQSWQDWFTGRKTTDGSTLFEVRNDSESQGIWVTFKDRKRGGFEHLLIDTKELRISQRLLEDMEGEKLAEIIYNNWITLEKCTQPTAIKIRGLAYNTEIELEMSNLSVNEKQSTFKIPVPNGFTRTYLP